MCFTHHTVTKEASLMLSRGLILVGLITLLNWLSKRHGVIAGMLCLPLVSFTLILLVQPKSSTESVLTVRAQDSSPSHSQPVRVSSQLPCVEHVDITHT